MDEKAIEKNAIWERWKNFIRCVNKKLECTQFVWDNGGNVECKHFHGDVQHGDALCYFIAHILRSLSSMPRYIDFKDSTIGSYSTFLYRSRLLTSKSIALNFDEFWVYYPEIWKYGNGKCIFRTKIVLQSIILLTVSPLQAKHEP